MKIRIQNQIQFDDQLEVMDQYYEGMEGKGGYHYLLYVNEEGEKIALKFHDQELTMTRFSTPKSIMKFMASEKGHALIPTPLGMQQFVIDTKEYTLEQNKLGLSYQLLTADESQQFATYRLELTWED
ncbi:MAG: DUF1934 domain-containing protein [Streptococcus sp.]